MSNLKITRCEGEGQGSCKRCKDNGKPDRNWMYFLYTIEGQDGCYCSECIKKMQKESRDNTEIEPYPMQEELKAAQNMLNILKHS